MRDALQMTILEAEKYAYCIATVMHFSDSEAPALGSLAGSDHRPSIRVTRPPIRN
jgi:hypothetical protein